MELMRTNVRMMRREKEAVSQVTFDEDYNVPDSRPDVGRIIQYKGKVLVEEVKASEARVLITGSLNFQVLYVEDAGEGRICSLDGKVPIEESMNLDGIESGDKICLKWDMEDLNLHLIHSRKLNVRALVTFEAAKEQAEEVGITTDLKCEGVSLKKKKLPILGLHVHNRDTMRIREEFNLASNKPDIHEILWDTVDVRGMDVRAEEGKAVVKGELFVFVLYQDSNGSDTLEWLEYSLPFQKEIMCENCTQDMVPDMDLTLLSSTLSVKPDADGEERVIQADIVLEMDLKMYREELLELLQDIYHPGKEYVSAATPQILRQLLVKNYAKCRVNDRISLENRSGKILQVCHSDGEVRVDDSRVVENGVAVDGIVQVKILYITGDDDMPFYSAEAAVPFSQVIEAPGIGADCIWNLHTDLEQLSTAMVDGNEIEIKALVNLNVLVLRETNEPIIDSVEERELNMEKLKMMPGIVGYVVKQGDTLWDIAKRFYTSVEVIKAVNNLTSDEIHPKDTLILVKNVEQ